MKELNRMGLGSKLGAKAKQETLRGMSPTGELAAPSGGLFGGLGLSDLFGGGGGARPGAGPASAGGLFGGPRPMGSSPTRKSGSKRKQKQKRKKGKGRH